MPNPTWKSRLEVDIGEIVHGGIDIEDQMGTVRYTDAAHAEISYQVPGVVPALIRVVPA